MKTLILILIVFMISFFVNQECFAQAAYLKDGVITVTLKDGAVYEFSSNEYMVVKRHVVVPTSLATASGASDASFDEYPKNRLTLHGGIGYVAEVERYNSSRAQIRERSDIVIGATYSRKVDETAHISGTILSNKTYLLGVGLDY